MADREQELVDASRDLIAEIRRRHQDVVHREDIGIWAALEMLEKLVGRPDPPPAPAPEPFTLD